MSDLEREIVRQIHELSKEVTALRERVAVLESTHHAQPVPAGMALVPIEPTYAMAQEYLKANGAEAMKGSLGFGASDPKLNFKAGYAAMLQAAKEKP